MQIDFTFKKNTWWMAGILTKLFHDTHFLKNIPVVLYLVQIDFMFKRNVWWLSDGEIFFKQ